MSEKQFVARNGIVAKANSTISGSLSVTGTITGSFSGSGTVESASFASTASYVNPLVQDVLITGSLTVSGSAPLKSEGLSQFTGSLKIFSPTDNNVFDIYASSSNSLGTNHPFRMYDETNTQRFSLAFSSGAQYLGSYGGAFFINRFNGDTYIGDFGNDKSLLVRYDNGRVSIKHGNATGSPLSDLSINGNLAVGIRVAAPTNGAIIEGTVGIGTITPSAKLQVKGSGTTDATTAFRVENANASASLEITDDNVITSYEKFRISRTSVSATINIFEVVRDGLVKISMYPNGTLNADTLDTNLLYTPTIDPQSSLGAIQLRGGSNSKGEAYVGGSGGRTLSVAGSTGFGIFSTFAPSNTTYDSFGLKIQPSITQPTSSTGTFYGIYYNPTIVSLSGSHTAIQTTNGDVKFQGDASVEITGSLIVTGSQSLSGSLNIYKSGSTVLDIQGSSGQLFSVTDSLTGSLFSVNTVAGLPVMEAFSDNTVNIGKFGVYPIKVINSGSSALITGSITSAETASYVNPLVQDVLITGSTFISSSNATQLQVGDNSLFVSGSGNIGIGTATPISKLHVVGGYYGSGEIIFGSSTGRLTNSGNDIFLDAVNAGSLILRTTSAEGLRINSSRNVGIGTSALGSGISARLQVRGSGTTSATTSFRVENSSTLPIIEAKDSQNIGIGYQALNATLNIGNNSYNGSLAVAATGSQNRVALLGNIEIVSNSTGGSWSGQSIAAEGANRTFRFFAGGALNSSDAEAFNFKTYFTSTRTVDYTAFRFNGGYSNNSLAANYTYLLVDGIINQTSINQSGSVTGILYNPSFVSLTGSHTAIQTTSGDIKFQGNNTVEITGSTFISSSNDTQLQVGNNSLFVSSSGDIGVGTTSPAYKLQVNGTARFGDGSPYLKVNPSSVEVEGAYLFAAYQAGVSFYAYESVFRGLIKSDGSGGNALKLGDTAERMRITGSNVGIGTTTPTSRLQVKGSGTTSATTAFLVENANASASLWVTDDQTVNTRQLLIVNHATNASRTLRLGWGSVFATDANNELTLGSNFNDDNSTRIYISGKTSDNSPSDAITMQTNNGVAIYSGSSGAWFNPAARLHVSGSGIFTDNLTVTGSLIIDDSLFDTLNTSSLSSGSHLLYSFSTGSYQAGFFDYYVTSGSNFRAGTVMSIAGAGTYKFTDQATPDIGDTSNLQFSMSLSTSNLQLYASASSDGWTVKTTFRTI